jgi:hypothetical protein
MLRQLELAPEQYSHGVTLKEKHGADNDNDDKQSSYLGVGERVNSRWSKEIVEPGQEVDGTCVQNGVIPAGP